MQAGLCRGIIKLFRNRRAILGDAWVDKSVANANAFTADSVRVGSHPFYVAGASATGT